MIRLLIAAGLLMMLLHAGPAWAGAAVATRPAGSDPQRREWQIPVQGRPTVVIFLHPGQKPSDMEVAQVRQDLLAAGQVAILGVVSGPDVARRAKAVEQWDWPLLIDETFGLSGTFEVHAWPTTIIFDSEGKVVGRIAGNPASLKGSLAAYSAYVSGAITRDDLNEELNRQQIVEDSAEQKALRHLLLAQELVASDRAEEAAGQLKQAQDLQPATEPVRLLMARDMLLLGEAKEADAVLETIPGTSRPGELALLRGWAAIAEGRWQEAREYLEKAQPLDPAEQAESQYWWGIIYQHHGDLARAAEAFRKAYESSTTSSAENP